MLKNSYKDRYNNIRVPVISRMVIRLKFSILIALVIVYGK